MRRQGIVWLGATVAVLGAAACSYNDPTSSLRNGPSRLQVTEISGAEQLQSVGSLAFLNLAVNDTVTVKIQVRDQQGNYYEFSEPTYSIGTATANMVTMPDTVQNHVPGNTAWKALIIGTAAGTTSAIITAAGVADTITVTVQ